MADTLEFKISEDLIKPILTAKINAAITEAMGGHDRLITDMLNVYMSVRVDDQGKVSTYSSDRHRTRLDWLVQQMVEEAMKTAMTAYLQGKKEYMIKEFEKFFNSKKGASAIIEAMQTGFCSALQDKWRISFNLSPAER